MITALIPSGEVCPACPGNIIAVTAAVIVLVPLFLRAVKERRRHLGSSARFVVQRADRSERSCGLTGALPERAREEKPAEDVEVFPRADCEGAEKGRGG